jgi:hypothetical protein
MRAAVLCLVLAGSLAVGCGSAPTAAPSPTPQPVDSGPLDLVPAPVPAAPSTRPTPAAAWVVGASPLPLRPDGFGQVLPTPTVLRDRKLPTADLLPPPADGQFAGTIARVTPAIRERMGSTWSPRCPVSLDQLRYLTVSFRGFDGRPHTGELVVARRVAQDVVGVFRTLYDENFAIEEMRLPTTADLTAAPTGDGNNTAAYVCRAARGQKRFSAHAYGTAVDINPFNNPDVKRDLVLPELASAYADRKWVRPGMFLAGSSAVRALTDIGWTWGGTYRSSKDYMHFSLSGL